jgi:hypothetical protein
MIFFFFIYTKYFRLSEHQLDTRRRGLESFLERICSVRAIVDHPVTRDFLTDNDSADADVALPDVDLKVMLPDQTCKLIKITRNHKTPQVLELVLRSLHIDTMKHMEHFGLFETVENNFGNLLHF